MGSEREQTKKKAPEPPRGFRFDPFADVRMGKSLFELNDDDWLVSIDDHLPTGKET